MILGIRLVLKDKVAFREEGGVLRQIGKPMDILRALPENVKIVHITDLNALAGNMTNFDLYDHMTYSTHIEVEVAPKEEMVKKFLAIKARVVLTLPCPLNLEKLKASKRLLVGKTNGKEESAAVGDYYVESLEALRALAKSGKRIFLYSNSISEEDAEKAGAFALIRDY